MTSSSRAVALTQLYARTGVRRVHLYLLPCTFSFTLHCSPSLPDLCISSLAVGMLVFWMKTRVSMRGTTFCQSVLAFNLILSFLVLLAISHPLIGVVGPRKTSKLRACGLFLHILKASHR